MDANNSEIQRRPKPGAVLITGAADRIGLELARECLDMGYHVIIHYRTSPEPAESVFVGDSRVTFVQAELTDSPQKFMAGLKNLPVALTGLINNASIFRPGDLSDPDRFHYMLSTNTLVPLRLSTEFAKCVDGGGWIINVTDARTRPMNKRYQNYRLSKLFLDELTRQLAYLYAPAIRVNAIAPGAVLAEANSESTDQFSDLSTNIPLNKPGDPRNVRQAARFLIENDYMTGAVIPVDGGWSL